jgi:hypothetical protein
MERPARPPDRPTKRGIPIDGQGERPVSSRRRWRLVTPLPRALVLLCFLATTTVAFSPQASLFSSRTAFDLATTTAPFGRDTPITAVKASPPPQADTAAADDRRPFACRAPQPRPARRLNHAFTHLHRHHTIDWPDEANRTSFNEGSTNPPQQDDDALLYLTRVCNYSDDQVRAMSARFPPLLTLSVERQLHPKFCFLTRTLGVTHPHLEEEDDDVIPAAYYGARLEKILAPRHAWLVHVNLTHGAALFRTPSLTTAAGRPQQQDDAGHGNLHNTLWTDFCRAARSTQSLAALCTQWSRDQHGDKAVVTTAPQLQAFEALFGRGLLAVARNELVQVNNTWPLAHFRTNDDDDNLSSKDDPRMRLTAADLARLLIQHGANPRAVDHRGVSLLHWAAGAGNLPVLQVLYEVCVRQGDNPGVNDPTALVTDRDQATLLHWAAAGADARHFGCGGHVHVCEYLLQRAPDARAWVQAVTRDGNSALHWAAWSGTLATVQLLVRHLADPHGMNRNGCSVAHWAASGGNLEVCQYLHATVGVDFTLANHGGNTPLTHAVAFGRASVVAWLRHEVLEDTHVAQDQAALDLAQDFVGWLPTDARRQQVLHLFQEFLDYDQGTAGTTTTETEDQANRDNFVY